MIRNSQELSLVRGGRQGVVSSSRHPSSKHRAPHQPWEGLQPAPPHLANALTDSLLSMEQRLSALLEDRERMGRDLHDSVLQSLYAIGLSLETSNKLTPSLPPAAATAKAQAVEQLNRLIHEIRGTIRRLENGTIQRFNLADELANLQRVYEQAGGVSISLELHPGALDVLTMEEEQEILHIVREALSNSVRHAHATHITVMLKARSARIRLTIADDGIGFDQTTQHRRGYGLSNMDTRARKLGGTLRIHSRPGDGTTLTVELFLAPLLAPV